MIPNATFTNGFIWNTCKPIYSYYLLLANHVAAVAYNHAGTGQKHQVSTVRMGENVITVILIMACLLMPDVLC